MTATSEHVWYHCGRCGSLFESEFGHRGSRTCGVCGKSPSIGTLPFVEKQADDTVTAAEAFAKKGETLSADEGGRRAVKKKRSSHAMMKMVVIWTFLMLVAVWIRHHYTTQESRRDALELVAENMTKGTLADGHIALLNKALPDCHRSLGGFLTAGTPEKRNQFVVNPIETAGKMALFYSSNAFPNVDVPTLGRTGQEIIEVGGVWMIRTLWKQKDGLEFEAVFRRDAGTWRLDWEHFSRFSEYPWALFLAGHGPEEAEFRLLARPRLASSENERAGSRLSFTLITPVSGEPGETGMESPDFVIDRRSDEGLLISAAMALREKGEQVFGQGIKEAESPGLVRLRVTVSRSELAGKRSFRLEKIHACHWITSDDVGFDLQIQRDDLFGN